MWERCRRDSVSKATFYNWTAVYGGTDESHPRRPKELETKNARLNRIYADPSLTQHVAAGCRRKEAQRPREQADPVTEMVSEYGVSMRSACQAVRLPRRRVYAQAPQGDDLNRDVQRIEIDTCLSARRIVLALTGLTEIRVHPAAPRMDNGPELINVDLDAWARRQSCIPMHVHSGLLWNFGLGSQ